MQTETTFASLPLPLNPASATILLMAAKELQVFPIGDFRRTKGVANWAMTDDDAETGRRNGWLVHCLARHQTGDDGDLCEEDREANRYAIEHGLRVFSVYTHPTKPETRIYIVTEADRSLTTVLFPDEY